MVGSRTGPVRIVVLGILLFALTSSVAVFVPGAQARCRTWEDPADRAELTSISDLIAQLEMRLPVADAAVQQQYDQMPVFQQLANFLALVKEDGGGAVKRAKENNQDTIPLKFVIDQKERDVRADLLTLEFLLHLAEDFRERFSLEHLRSVAEAAATDAVDAARRTGNVTDGAALIALIKDDVRLRFFAPSGAAGDLLRQKLAEAAILAAMVDALGEISQRHRHELHAKECITAFLGTVANSAHAFFPGRTFQDGALALRDAVKALDPSHYQSLPLGCDAIQLAGWMQETENLVTPVQPFMKGIRDVLIGLMDMRTGEVTSQAGPDIAEEIVLAYPPALNRAEARAESSLLEVEDTLDRMRSRRQRVLELGQSTDENRCRQMRNTAWAFFGFADVPIAFARLGRIQQLYVLDASLYDQITDPRSQLQSQLAAFENSHRQQQQAAYEEFENLEAIANSM